MRLNRRTHEYVQIVVLPDPADEAEGLWVKKVGRQRSLPGYKGLVRVTPYPIFIVVTQGSGELEVDHRKWRLKAGDTFCFLPKSISSWRTNEDDLLSMSWIAVAGPAFPGLLEQIGFHPQRPVHDTADCCSRLDSMVREMLQELTQRKTGYRWKVKGLMWAFAAELLRAGNTHRGDTGANAPLPHRVIDPRIQRTLEHIDLHLDSPLTIEQLASVAGLSRSHFALLFTRNVGIAPKTYVQKMRLERAKDLLVTTEIPIGEIAGMVGFADQAHFTRRFVQHESIPPIRYRKNVQSVSL